jgi:hypothetical protein
MKKLLFVALFFTFGQQLFAQEGTKIGVSFGTAFTSYTEEVAGKQGDGQNGTGTRIAINYRKGFKENYGIQTGVAFTTKVFDKEGLINPGKTVLSAIEVPIMLSMRTNELSSGLYVHGFVGPTLDVYVSSRNKENGNTDVKDDFNSIGSTVKFGTAVEKEFDFGTVSLGLSYNRGITDVTDDSNINGKIHYFAIEAGFFF